MLQIIAIVAVVLAIAVAIVLILAATKPDSFSVERTAVVKAPAGKIFPLISNFHQWASWSPWENRDPAMKRNYSGAETGKGAVYTWEGNKNVGSFMNLDRMIGKDFEAGLANLKRITEK